MPKINLGRVRGPKGDSIEIKGAHTSLEYLKEHHPTGTTDEAYVVDGVIYVYDPEHTDWVPVDLTVYSLIDMEGSVVLSQGAEPSLTFAVDSENAKTTVDANLVLPDMKVDVPVFAGATELVNGRTGTVPAPLAGVRSRALMADGIWREVELVEDGAGEDDDGLKDGEVYLSSLYTGIMGSTPVVRFGKYLNAVIEWLPIDVNHAEMPEESVLLLAKCILALRCFDAKEPNNPTSTRASKGNNDYTVSNQRQWLNSDQAGNQWYSAQHAYDAPPSGANVQNGSSNQSGYNPYQSKAGFLYQFTDQEKDMILSTTRTIGGYSGNGKTCIDKVFSLTSTEVGVETRSANGTKIAIFTNNDARVAFPTSQCVSDSTYKDTWFSTSQAWHWYLATSDSSYAEQAMKVDNVGGQSKTDAYFGMYGVRPALNLPTTTRCRKVSENVYEVVTD